MFFFSVRGASNRNSAFAMQCHSCSLVTMHGVMRSFGVVHQRFRWPFAHVDPLCTRDSPFPHQGGNVDSYDATDRHRGEQRMLCVTQFVSAMQGNRGSERSKAWQHEVQSRVEIKLLFPRCSAGHCQAPAISFFASFSSTPSSLTRYLWLARSASLFFTSANLW